MEKREFTVQQIKEKIGANKVISIQVVIITKKSCVIHRIKTRCSQWIRTCIILKMVEKRLRQLEKRISTWIIMRFGLIQATQTTGL